MYSRSLVYFLALAVFSSVAHAEKPVSAALEFGVYGFTPKKIEAKEILGSDRGWTT